jgi:uracil-DNA glycosylase
LTGDSSGDFLFGALYRAGFANQPGSVARNDRLKLTNVYIGAAARCAPPDNKPLPSEFANCFPYLAREFELLTAHDIAIPRPRPKFGHNAQYSIGKYAVIGTYHPSRQNTNTGKLTAPMMDAVFQSAQRALGVFVPD